MFTLKRLSLAAALITLTGCMTSADNQADNYYDNDFALENSHSKENSVVERSPQETANRGTNAQMVSEVSKRVAAVETKLRQIQKNMKKDAEVFKDLKAKSAEESRRYYEYVARIQSRLQIGTTPGNPELVEMWKQASALLTGSDQNMSDTAKLSTEMVRTKNELDALLENIREVFQVPGAMEIDHENLKSLEDQANQTIVSLNRLSSDIALQITRLQHYFTTESQNINGLSTDIQNGIISNGMRSSANTSIQPPAQTFQSVPSDLPEANLEGRRPLMVIRFDRRKIEYEQSLYKAVKAALDKRPATKFEVVAVSPSNTKTGETEAVRNAEGVKEALLAMGLPAGRIYLSKTGKDSIKTTEVHLYLRQ